MRGNDDSPALLLKNYPMEARNKNIATAQLAAVNAILSNILNGKTLAIMNFSKLTNDERGFSRTIFLSVLNHLIEANLIARYYVMHV